MRDPYEVLGVRKGASKEEIKRAYLELVKKYHPDKFADNPLKELAEEKLKEINEAYNILMNDGNSYANENTYNFDYQQIRELILRGRFIEAENILRQNQKDESEWYYLMGMVCERKGWAHEAYKYYQNAYRKNPYNMEYRVAKERFENNSRNYEWSAWNRGYQRRDDCDVCSICQIIMCWECCCDNDCGGC